MPSRLNKQSGVELYGTGLGLGQPSNLVLEYSFYSSPFDRKTLLFIDQICSNYIVLQLKTPIKTTGCGYARWGPSVLASTAQAIVVKNAFFIFLFFYKNMFFMFFFILSMFFYFKNIYNILTWPKKTI